MPRRGATDVASRIFDAAPLAIGGPSRTRDGPQKNRDRPAESRPVVEYTPCGECGLQVRYVRGDMSLLLKHMSVAHPGRDVLHFGSSEVEEDEAGEAALVEDTEPASREDCTACAQIKEQLLSHLGQYSKEEVSERKGDRGQADEKRSSEIGRVKINLEVDKNDMPRRSKLHFTRTMKNDDKLYRSETTRAKSKPGKPLSRELPMALRHLQQAGVDIGRPDDVKQTMVFHPPGKMYSNFRKFTCPKCSCELAPTLTAIKEGRKMETSWVNNQCFLTICWPLMLLPIFVAQPTVSFHMRCAQCDHYLGKLDKNGSVVAEVVGRSNDASPASDVRDSETHCNESGGTGDSDRADRGRSPTRLRGK